MAQDKQRTTPRRDRPRENLGSDENVKSRNIPIHDARFRAQPLQEYFEDDKVRWNAGGITKYGTISGVRLRGGRWEYQLVVTSTREQYNNGEWVAERLLDPD